MNFNEVEKKNGLFLIRLHVLTCPALL